MALQRRDFLKAVGLAGAAIAAGGAGRPRAARAQDRPGEADAQVAVLNVSSQEGIIPGDSLKEKVDRMAEWGFQGLEPGGGGLPGRIDEIKAAVDGTPVKISAICGGYSGVPISQVEDERSRFKETFKELLTAAAAVGSTGVIVVPAFNNQTELSNREARPILIDVLKEVGEHAVSVGCRALLEPLNRGEAFFLRQLADAAAICRDVDSPGICMMGDFYHMNIEETSDRGAFISAGKYLHHVHLASRRRVMPGQDERSFVEGFRGLKDIGYQDFCSLECGCDGDRMVEIPKAVKFLRQQWEEARP